MLSEARLRREPCSEPDFAESESSEEAAVLAEQPARGWLSRVTVSFAKLPWLAVKMYAQVCAQSLRWWLAAWQILQIFFCISKLFLIHFICRQGIIRPSTHVAGLFTAAGRVRAALRRRMQQASDYHDWALLSKAVDQSSDAFQAWLAAEDSDVVDFRALRKHTRALRKARHKHDAKELAFLLRVCCHRNFCGLRNPVLYAYSFVATKTVVEAFYAEVLESLGFLDQLLSVGREALPPASPSSARQEGRAELPRFREFAARKYDSRNYQPAPAAETSSPVSGTSSDSSAARKSRSDPSFETRTPAPASDMPAAVFTSSASSSAELLQACDARRSELLLGFSQEAYINLLSDLRLAMGRTALCLSGGGGLSIYHAGVAKTLIEENLMPRVISGTSGGSIMAAILATRNNAEVLELVQKGGFMDMSPPFLQQIRNLFKIGTLLRQEDFCNHARRLIGDYTFAEAFNKTGRFVSITTTRAGRQASGDPLVCNVINTPTVLVWSAMVASCSLPLVLPPMKLVAKNDDSNNATFDLLDTTHAGVLGQPSSMPRKTYPGGLANTGLSSAGLAVDERPSWPATGEQLPEGTRWYAPGDMKFVDGSILQDIPTTELQTSFNVKSFLVSQVNPHFTPFIQDARGYQEKQNWFVSFVEKVWNYVTLDLRNRYQRLLVLAIVPSIKGQDVSPFLMQSAEGHCTIVPANPSDFYKVTCSPTMSDLERAVVCGMKKTWPYVFRIRHMTCIELKLRQLWQKHRKI